MVDVETQDFWSAMNKEKVLQRSVKILIPVSVI